MEGVSGPKPHPRAQREKQLILAVVFRGGWRDPCSASLVWIIPVTCQGGAKAGALGRYHRAGCPSARLEAVSARRGWLLLDPLVSAPQGLVACSEQCPAPAEGSGTGGGSAPRISCQSREMLVELAPGHREAGWKAWGCCSLPRAPTFHTSAPPTPPSRDHSGRTQLVTSDLLPRHSEAGVGGSSPPPPHYVS